jgi:hypothetical protein
VGGIAAVIIDAKTVDTSSTYAYLGARANMNFDAAGVAVNADKVRIAADHLVDFNSKANGTVGGVIGVGNTTAENEITPLVYAAVGNSAVIGTTDLKIIATNNIEKDWLPNNAYNAQSASGGLADIPAPQRYYHYHLYLC